ncbi:MAG: hypothetical protein R3F44_12205 [Candidatus Competibacteraceae bacterium]
MKKQIMLLWKNRFILLAIVAGCWLIAIIAGMIAAFPVSIIGFVAIIGIGLLFAKVIRERLANKEDNYYSKKYR